MPSSACSPSRPLLRPSLASRLSSTPHYQTLPTIPPRGSGKPPPSSSDSLDYPASRGTDDSRSSSYRESPLPKRQLIVLAIIALAEQTALNSISPYLPEMAGTFPEVQDAQIGLYVGLIASSFALAQFATNYFWGWASDCIGRKPIVVLGTISTATCLVAFGFCRTLWQAVLVQVLMGLFNGNQVVISTCLGEITDRTNQHKAFTYLPVIYGLGGITGPLIGGLLVFEKSPINGEPYPYPYLAPNLFGAAILLVDALVTIIWLEESLEGAPSFSKLLSSVASARLWARRNLNLASREADPIPSKNLPGHGHQANQFADIDEDDLGFDDDATDGDDDLLDVADLPALSAKTVFTRDTILLLISYLIFQFGNISFNSLYPIFGQASPPLGRDLSPEEIGTSQGFAGAVTIIFQLGIFGKLRDRMGNKISYRVGLLLFVVAFILMPFIGYKDGRDGMGAKLGNGKAILYAELGAVLTIKTVAAVGCLTASLLLITNSAPNHHVLGSLNGLAQTLSASGRAVGPFISGSLFTASTRVKPKGEALAFGVFGGVCFIAFLLSFGIRGEKLEGDSEHDHHERTHSHDAHGEEGSGDHDHDHDDDDDDDDDDD